MAFTSKKTSANKAFEVFNTPEKKQADSNIWLNIGVMSTVKHEDGTETEEFISLPINMSLNSIQSSDIYKYLTSGKPLSPINKKKLNLIRSIENKADKELVEDVQVCTTKLQVQLYKSIPVEEQIIENSDEFDDLI